MRICSIKLNDVLNSVLGHATYPVMSQVVTIVVHFREVVWEITSVEPSSASS